MYLSQLNFDGQKQLQEGSRKEQPYSHKGVVNSLYGFSYLSYKTILYLMVILAGDRQSSCDARAIKHPTTMRLPDFLK